MKAWVCREYKSPFHIAIEDIETPEVGPDEVQIKVAAAGLAFGETVLLEGAYQAKPPLPYVPISELSGVVSAVGRDVSRLKVGDPVFGFSFKIRGGALAKFVTLPQECVFAKPRHLSFVQAAALPINYWTVFHALFRRGSLKETETLVVYGATGGIGIVGVHFGKMMGARVIAVGSDNEKLKIASAHGADHVLNHTSCDLRSRLLELTEGRGADVFLDPVGGDLFDIAMRAIAPYGRILVVGFTSGRPATPKTNILLVKMAAVIGVYAGAAMEAPGGEAAADVQDMLELIESRQVTPFVSKAYSFEQAAEGLRDIKGRLHTGKCVAVVSAELCSG